MINTPRKDTERPQSKLIESKRLYSIAILFFFLISANHIQPQDKHQQEQEKMKVIDEMSNVFMKTADNRDEIKKHIDILKRNQNVIKVNGDRDLDGLRDLDYRLRYSHKEWLAIVNRVVNKNKIDANDLEGVLIDSEVLL